MIEQLANLWQEHYRNDGEVKVALRQKLYMYNSEHLSGEPPVDLELEAMQALRYAGLRKGATIADLGCSYPHFLLNWRLHGHTGRLIGIEPNTTQFGGLPYWRKSEDRVRPAERIITPFRAAKDNHLEAVATLELYEAPASAIPLADGTLDAITSMYMFYHIERSLQHTALQEIKRVLLPGSGVLALTTRGTDNKQGIRQNELAIAEELTRRRGRPVFPPPAVNAGFTSEDARLVLPQHFRYVYEYRHSSSFIFADAQAAWDLEEAYWTLLDMYRDSDDQPPGDFDFALAFEKVMYPKLQQVREGRSAIEDQLEESLFIASDRPLLLPEDKMYCRLPRG